MNFNCGRLLILLILSIWIAIFFSINLSTSAAQPLLEQPNLNDGKLQLGETLIYSVKIRGLGAGSRVLKIAGQTSINGYKVYHIESDAKTNRFFSFFYDFEDHRDSYVLEDEFYPVRYELFLIDGKRKADIRVDFDPELKKAILYEGQKRKEIEVPMKIQDELSMLYLIRLKDLKLGEYYEFPALIGTKSMNIELQVVSRDLLNTPIGKVPTLLIKDIKSGHKIWLTDDYRRIPVKIEAQTKIGSLTAELKKVEL